MTTARASLNFRSDAAKTVRQTLICFSHLRWNFVHQRPQHLMSLFAQDRRVVFWEETVRATEGNAPLLDVSTCPKSGVMVVTPHLPDGLSDAQQLVALGALLDTLLASEEKPPVAWYYTPMMLPFSRHIDADVVVYDCMDELSAFRFAPANLLALENELLDLADLVFTGGQSLYEAKRDRHAAVHCFPSSVDQPHFAAARGPLPVPADQVVSDGPVLGYYGVIDERIDLDLIAGVARLRPDWQVVMVGPVVKIDVADLPRAPNIHYPGGKSYDALPGYLRGWNVALMPFAINAATRFISPTKTPEYLAGGLPVVSTPVRDVVAGYGDLARVHIADSAEAFVAACDAAIAQAATGAGRDEADAAISDLSWTVTYAGMNALIVDVAATSKAIHPISSASVWGENKRERYDYLVVGAGFAGAVMAERLAADGGKRVLVVDRRPHIGGNAYDRRDDAGLLMHQYGPHIFHTNSAEVKNYLSQFTSWRPYEHRVLGAVDGHLVPIPINRTTINTLYGLDLATDDEAAAWLTSRAEPVDVVETSEDVVVSAVGRELYQKFFQGYTRKQWGLDPAELDKSVTARVPTRASVDDRYFTDTFQAMPAKGYTAMFAQMLDHPNIDVLLGTDYREIRNAYDYGSLVFTGPIDEYFGFCYGALPYRSLVFVHETINREVFQPVATVNYPSEDVPYTRITEYKYLTGETGAQTSITYEYPSATGDPYYPIPRPENQRLFKRYQALADAEPNVVFVGRLATYRYYNMDQVVAQALATYRKLDAAVRVEEWGAAPASGAA
ncbi:UDP-galactopyranose mutase [Sphingomonas sp.]|uniref:UDP-galactopyranose mutase n=1 Tax=Sphingomonas sp. TaxID=28214 RepID=UPI0025E6290D|nr:UDP-galactopyranose mutase [Sphingomonas sp.]